MSKILITGNGFDLAHGLPTRYADFIEVIKLLDEYSTVSTDIKDYFDLDKRTDNNKQIELFNNCKPLDLILLNRLKNKLNNTWLNYFKYELNIETWIDFESSLENVIKQLDINLKNINDSIFKRDYNFTDIFFIKDYDFLNKYRTRNLLSNFGIINFIDNTPSFQINFDFCHKDIDYEISLGFHNDLFFSKLSKEWEAFVSLFNDYLLIFVEPLIEQIPCTSQLKFDKHFTFNYTDTYSKIILSNTETTHLHGKLSKFNFPNEIVLGYNLSKEFTKNQIQFTKGFQRMNYNVEIDLSHNIKNHNGVDIYIWGHSLDISDKKFLEEILKLIEEGSCLNNNFLTILYKKTKKELFKNLIYIFGEKRISNLIINKKIIFMEAKIENIIQDLEINREVSIFV